MKILELLTLKSQMSSWASQYFKFWNSGIKTMWSTWVCHTTRPDDCNSPISIQYIKQDPQTLCRILCPFGIWCWGSRHSCKGQFTDLLWILCQRFLPLFHDSRGSTRDGKDKGNINYITVHKTTSPQKTSLHPSAFVSETSWATGDSYNHWL